MKQSRVVKDSLGTMPLPADFRPGIVVGRRFFFFVTTPAAGYEPWKSDGTRAGTTMIADLRNALFLALRR